MGQRAGDRCGICDTLDPVELTRYDLIVGDPARWPRTLWKENGWEPPKGLLPPHYRAWGQNRVGRDWLDSHGYNDISESLIKGHMRHVARVARRPVELADVGLISGQPVTKDIPNPRSVDPNAYLAYYAAGVRVGIRGLALLERRIDAIEKADKEVPLDLIKMMVDAGSRLATSQAQIRSRGMKMGEDSDDDAFRRAASPEDNGEVTRIGHIRIRTIDGEARPVTDDGLGDRTDYNERAAREGNPGLLS